jgi:SAM-dependent methyltransferase
MRPELYQQVFSVQGDHWWSRSRRKLALDLLERFGVPERCQYIDIGCGTGQNLRLLDSHRPSRVVGVDISPIALEFARKACPRSELIQADISSELPFPEETFEIATIFNVLYHTWIANDLGVLKEARRVLRPNGLLLITEPAFPALAREIDIADMAARRYRLKPFIELLRAADFEMLYANYFTSFGAPIILGLKAMKGVTGKTAVAGDAPDMRPMNPLLNAVFYGLARVEANLVKASLPMPFGTTIICVARRR